MTSSKLYNAIFAAGISLILSCLMIGVKLDTDSSVLAVKGATAEQWMWIAGGITIVFLSQLFSAQIDALFGAIPKPNLKAVLPQDQKMAVLKPWLIAAVIVGMLIWPFMVFTSS